MDSTTSYLRVSAVRSAALLLLAAMVSGCVGNNHSRPPGQRITDVPKTEAEPAAHLKQPAKSSLSASDFEKLWASIQRVTRNAGYRTDRDDPRLGVLTTRSLVSSQVFEPWRWNAGSLHGLLEATLGTVRRTVRWDVTRNDDGSFTATPRVLVERYTVIEHRITSAAQYSEIFALTREESRNQRLRQIDPSMALQEEIPTAYWYAIGRDEALEQVFAARVKARL